MHILSRYDEKSTKAKQFNEALEKGMEFVGQYGERQYQKNLLEEQNKQEQLKIKQIHEKLSQSGIDPEGMDYKTSAKLFSDIIKQERDEDYINKLLKPSQKSDKNGPITAADVEESVNPEELGAEQLAGIATRKPAVANTLTHLKDVATREEREKTKAATKEKEFFHNESSKYAEELRNQADSAVAQDRAIDRQLAQADKIGWGERALNAVLAKTPFSDLFKSKNAQEMDANLLAQFPGMRQLLGGILSDSDIKLILQKFVTSSKSPEANKIIVKTLKYENGLRIAKQDIAKEVVKENGGYRPADFASIVDQRFQEKYGKQIHENFSELMNLPDDGENLKKVGRRLVPQGTKPTTEVLNNYLKMFNNDPDQAAQAAEEDGYDIS